MIYSSDGSCPLRLSNRPTAVSFSAKTARQREWPNILRTDVSDRRGETTTFGNPPARVAISAHSHSRLFSPRIATRSPLASPRAQSPKIALRRHGQPQKLNAAARLAGRQRRPLGHSNARDVIDEGRERLGRVVIRRNMRQETFDVQEHGMAAGRSENRRPAFESTPEIVHLFYPGGDVGVAGKDFS